MESIRHWLCLGCKLGMCTGGHGKGCLLHGPGVGMFIIDRRPTGLSWGCQVGDARKGYVK